MASTTTGNRRKYWRETCEKQRNSNVTVPKEWRLSIESTRTCSKEPTSCRRNTTRTNTSCKKPRYCLKGRLFICLQENQAVNDVLYIILFTVFKSIDISLNSLANIQLTKYRRSGPVLPLSCPSWPNINNKHKYSYFEDCESPKVDKVCITAPLLILFSSHISTFQGLLSGSQAHEELLANTVAEYKVQLDQLESEKTRYAHDAVNLSEKLALIEGRSSETNNKYKDQVCHV